MAKKTTKAKTTKTKALKKAKKGKAAKVKPAKARARADDKALHGKTKASLTKPWSKAEIEEMTRRFQTAYEEVLEDSRAA